MKKEFSENTTEIFTKTTFHYIPEILKYIDEIHEPRKRKKYSMRYLIMSEIMMFLSEGKSQRFTETEYTVTKYFENIGKIGSEKNTRCRNIYKCVFKNRGYSSVRNLNKHSKKRSFNLFCYAITVSSLNAFIKAL